MARPSILAAAAEHVAWLESHDVSTVLTTADLVPPAVLIMPPVFRPQFGSARVDLLWTFYAVAGDTVRAPALELLSELLDALADAYPGQWSEATPATLSAGGDLGDLPAYRIQITTRLENTP